jgi:GntR family galactonate operon transcriptional repressor
VFHRIGGMIDAALRFSLHETTEHSPDIRAEALGAHWDVVEALRVRDPEAARKAVNHILDLAERDLKSATGMQPNKTAGR